MRTAVLAAAVLAACVSSGRAALILIDFDELPGARFDDFVGVVPEAHRLGEQYLRSHQVRFRSSSPWATVVELGSWHTCSGCIGIGGSTIDGRLSYLRSDPLIIEFGRLAPEEHSGFEPMATDFVSVRTDRVGHRLDLVTLAGFDIDGRLIASCSVVDFGDMTLQLCAPGISRAEFYGAAEYGGVALDDLMFGRVHVVPEAAGAPLLAALLVRRRARRGG